MKIIVKEFHPISTLKFDDSSGSGSVSGYATTFDNQPDTDGDRVLAGAAGMNTFTAPMLLVHDRQKMPVGGSTLTPDAFGVQVVGNFANTQHAQDARETARVGGYPAFSIGFTSDDYTKNEFGGMDFRTITIKEVSLVPVPANTRALVTAVKSAKTDGTHELKKAYVDVEPPEGTFEAIQEDIVDALTEYYSIDGIDSVYVQLIATFPETAVYSVSSYPHQDSDGTYQVTYLRPAEDTLTLGNPTAVEIQQSIAPDNDNFTLPTAAVGSEMSDEDKATLKSAEEAKAAEGENATKVQLVIADTREKGGKRNADKDQKALDGIHDAAVNAGANCPGMEKSGEVEHVATSDLALLAELAELEAEIG